MVWINSSRVFVEYVSDEVKSASSVVCAGLVYRDKIIRMMDSEDYRVTYDVFAVCRKGIYPAVVIVPPMNVSVEQNFFIIAENPYCNTLRSIPMGKQNVQGIQNQLS